MKYSTKWLYIALLSLVFCSGLEAQTTYNLTPTDDASLKTVFNFQSENFQKLKTENGKFKGFLKFDLSGISGTVTSASLEMTLSDFPQSGDVHVYKCSDSNWSETAGFSTSTAPPYNTATDQIDIQTPATYSPLGATLAWSLDPSKIDLGGLMTFALEKNTGKNFFGSKENSSLDGPKLVLVVDEGGGSEIASTVGAPAVIKNADDEVVLDVSSKAAGSELSIQGRNGQGRTIVNIKPYGDDYRAFLNLWNDSDGDNTGTVRLGVRNSYGILSATNTDNGLLETNKKTQNVAIELDPGDKFTGELFQVSTNGFVDDGVVGADEKILFHVQEDGSVGIGTTNPAQKFHLKNGLMYIEETNTHASTILNRTDGKSIALTAAQNAGSIRFDSTGSLKIQSLSGADIVSGANSNVTTIMEIHGAAPENCMVLDAEGKLGLGMADMSADESMLQVKGTLLAQKIKVRPDATNPVPDFVFEKDYPLLSLKDLAAYISANKHLPEIPSAAEVEENGLFLDEMSLKLLQKVEELTLYLLQQQQQIDSLKTQNEVLLEKVNTLEQNNH